MSMTMIAVFVVMSPFALAFCWLIQEWIDEMRHDADLEREAAKLRTNDADCSRSA